MSPLSSRFDSWPGAKSNERFDFAMAARRPSITRTERRHKQQSIVIMPGIPFTKAEDRAIIKRWGKDNAQSIADFIGRNRRSVYDRAYRLGVGEKRDQQAMEKRKAKIVQLHSKGWSDQEIADVIGIGRRCIAEHRVRMGLLPNGRNERYRKRVAATTKRQCKAAGVKSLAEIKAKEIKNLANSLGWPDSLPIRAIQIVETLYQRGPMTRRQLAEAIGMRWKGSRKTFSTNRVHGHSYLAALVHDGLVVRLKKAITHKGKGNHEDVYMLGLEVEPCQVNRSKSQLRRLKIPLPENPVRSQCKANCDKQFSTASAKRMSRKSSPNKSRRPSKEMMQRCSSS
jgi:hypothetical protein